MFVPGIILSNKTEISNKINDEFLAPLYTFQPLEASNFICFSDDTNNSRLDFLTVSEEDVYKCLESLNPSKSLRPDNIPLVRF